MHIQTIAPRIALFFCTVLSIGASTFAHADPAPPERPPTITDGEIERLVRFRIDRQQRATSAVIGVLRPSGRSVIAHRTAHATGGVAPRGDTVFEIASLTKIFTGLLLADAVTRGELAFDDPLARFVPEGVPAPDYPGRPITLLDLATHTSALPLRPANLHALPDAPNKYAGYTLEQLYDGLSAMRLDRAPGTQFEYSNLGFALLGVAIAAHAHESFSEVLRHRITEPLALNDTQFGDDPRAAPRRAQGHDMELRPIGPTDDGALNPAGGLRSTANDLLRFLELFVDQSSDGPVARAAKSMLDVDRPGPNPDTRMALGWRRTTAHGETYYWSNGSGDGSRTFMGFNPVRGVAVVALADAASGDGLDDIGRRFLDPAQPVDLKVVPRLPVVDVPAASIDRVLGTYRYAPDDAMTVTRGATGLIVTAGTAQFLVKPTSRTRFTAPDSPDLYLEFPGSPSRPAAQMVFHQAGQQWVYVRTPVEPN